MKKIAKALDLKAGASEAEILTAIGKMKGVAVLGSKALKKSLKARKKQVEALSDEVKKILNLSVPQKQF